MKKLTTLLTLFLVGNWLLAQRTINGTVVAVQDEKPLPEVIVQLKGTEISTLTNKKGAYKLQLPAPEAYDITFTSALPTIDIEPALIFSFDGYETQEVKIDTLEEINLALRQIYATTSVNITDPTTATYSVGQLDVREQAFLSSPYTALGWASKLAGVNISATGNQAGADGTILLRSIQQLSGDQQPLVLLDGIYLNTTSLADIDPEDIAHVEFLKGSAASAMYGSRGANGVVLIRTRRGKDLNVGESRVIYRTEYGVTEAANSFSSLDQTNLEVLNDTGAQPVLGNPTEGNTFSQALPSYTDYQDEFLFQRGNFVSNYFAIEGRSGNTSMAASASRFKDNGIIQENDGFTRSTVRLNLDHYLNRNLSFSGSTTYSFSNQEVLNTNDPNDYFSSALLLTPMFNLDVPNEEDGTAFDWDIDNTGQQITNPLYTRANSELLVNRTRLLGNFSALYNANNWLQLSYATLLDRSTNQFQHFLQKGFLGTNLPGNFEETAIVDVAGSAGGGFQETKWTNQTYVSDFGLRIDHRTAGFDVDLGLNFLYEDIVHRYESLIGEDLAVIDTRSFDNIRGNIRASSIDQNIVSYAGIFQTNLNYKNTYILSGGFRLEQSSIFGERTTNAGYYRVGAAYRLTEDIKLKGLDELKLRVAIGTAGARPTFEQRYGTVELQNGTVTKNTLENPELLPALSQETEIGIDATIGKSIDLTFNYVLSTVEDQILLAPLSGGTGFAGRWENAGTLEGELFEASLGINFARIMKAEASGFKWYANATFDRYQPTVAALDVPDYLIMDLFKVEEGVTPGAMYGEVFATSSEQLSEMGETNVSDFVQNDLGYMVRQDVLGTAREAPYKLRDENGNPLIQEIGNTNPDFRMGISNRIGFKGLELYTLFDWKNGGDIYNLTKQRLYEFNRHEDLGTYNTIAATFFGSDGLQNEGVYNNHFVEDGSYFMLREAALSYTLKKAQLQGFLENALESVQISLIGRNLFTWTQYTGVHPDVTPVGYNENQRQSGRVESANAVFAIDNFNYPMRRTLTASLKVIF